MSKLIAEYAASPTEKNRTRLQNYLNKHQMAVCMALPYEVAILLQNGFKF